MTDDARFEVVDPEDADALASVEAYFAELDQRFPQGFEGSVGHATADAPRYRSPGGAFVVAQIDGRTVGCGAVHTIEPGVGEIKRMWVDPSARGRRIGLGLLDALEQVSRDLGHGAVRLDTNEHLPEAIAMYRRAGYAEIERYNDNPYPTHFFEKTLR